MDKILIVCKSITHAQKIQSVIKNASFWCGIDRTPRRINNKKCSYSVTVNACDFDRICTVLSVFKVNDVYFYKIVDKNYILLEVFS